MVFSSFLFLFLFLPLFWLSYFLSPKRLKNFCALIWSYFFYGWGAPTVLPCLIVLSVFDFIVSRWMSQRSGSARKLACALGVGVNLLFLGYFKYANFFVAEVNSLLQSAGLNPIVWLEIALPIGISFFTFQKISYLVDVYRGTTPAAERFTEYALYVALFPQLIAGPIIRYHDIQAQITERTHRIDLVFSGLVRFSIGLAKKVLIADAMGNVADTIFNLPIDSLTTGYAWLGALAYAYQIYFDFSGYSDMAIGLGRILGFRIPENFNTPYVSQTITEFWRRWHISLSNWMREYLYIPLGGNRVAPARIYLNLWIVFLLSGLWHGASWTFVAWGALHGLFLTIDKLFWSRASQRLPKIVNVVLTFGIVLISWVLFRAEDFSIAFEFIKRMICFTEYWDVFEPPVFGLTIHTRGLFVCGLATVLVFAPICTVIEQWASNFWSKEANGWQTGVQMLVASCCFALAILSLSTTDYNPFIYFRF